MVHVQTIKQMNKKPSPIFCSLVCVRYNTWKWKSGKKWGRPGNTSHKHGCEVDTGGGSSARLPNSCTINLRASFLLFRLSALDLVKVCGPG